MHAIVFTGEKFSVTLRCLQVVVFVRNCYGSLVQSFAILALLPFGQDNSLSWGLSCVL